MTRSLISQDVHSPTPHLSFGTVCLQKSCCAIRNIKDILRHSCLNAVTRLSDPYLTSASAAFCRHTWCFRHTWRFINLLIIIIIIFKLSKKTRVGKKLKKLRKNGEANVPSGRPTQNCCATKQNWNEITKQKCVETNTWFPCRPCRPVIIIIIIIIIKDGHPSRQ